MIPIAAGIKPLTSGANTPQQLSLAFSLSLPPSLHSTTYSWMCPPIRACGFASLPSEAHQRNARVRKLSSTVQAPSVRWYFSRESVFQMCKSIKLSKRHPPCCDGRGKGGRKGGGGGPTIYRQWTINASHTLSSRRAGGHLRVDGRTDIINKGEREKSPSPPFFDGSAIKNCSVFFQPPQSILSPWPDDTFRRSPGTVGSEGDRKRAGRPFFAAIFLDCSCYFRHSKAPYSSQCIDIFLPVYK